MPPSLADPGTIYQGPSIGIRFSKDSPDGPLYFWSAATNGVMRGAIGTSFAGKLYPERRDVRRLPHGLARRHRGWRWATAPRAVSALQSIDVHDARDRDLADQALRHGLGDLLARWLAAARREQRPAVPARRRRPACRSTRRPARSRCRSDTTRRIPSGRPTATTSRSRTPRKQPTQPRRQGREHRAARVRRHDADVQRARDPRALDGGRQLLLSEVLARRRVPRVRPRDRGRAWRRCRRSSS